MRIKNTTRRTSGVALVTVLVIAAVTIALAYGALSVSTRLVQGSKSAESYVQARLNAESGLDAAFVLIESEFSEGKSPLAISRAIPNINVRGSLMHEFGRDYSFSANKYPIVSGEEIELLINGLTPTGATYTTNAQVFYESGMPADWKENPQTVEQQLYRGITSCAALDVTAGGKILGTGSLFIQTNITVDGGIDLGNNDVYVLENLTTTGSAKIGGNIFARGNVTLGAGSSTYKKVFSESNITINNTSTFNGEISEDVLVANGNVVFNSDATVYGNIAAGNKVQTNGRNISGEWTKTEDLGQILSLNLSACNSNVPQIQGEVTRLSQALTQPSRSLRVKADSYDHRDWWITPESIKSTNGNGGNPKNYPIDTPQTVTFLNNAYSVTRLRSFVAENHGSNIYISGGDVVLFVDEPVSFAASRNLHIAADSSLTIITPNRIEFKSGGGDPNWKLINNSRKPSLTFFTSFGGAATDANLPAFSVGGGQAVPVLVYAPNQSVETKNGGHIIGAVLGKGVAASGGTSITYDSELLSLIAESGSGEEQGLVIVKRR